MFQCDEVDKHPSFPTVICKLRIPLPGMASRCNRNSYIHQRYKPWCPRTLFCSLYLWNSHLSLLKGTYCMYKKLQLTGAIMKLCSLQTIQSSWSHHDKLQKPLQCAVSLQLSVTVWLYQQGTDIISLSSVYCLTPVEKTGKEQYIIYGKGSGQENSFYTPLHSRFLQRRRQKFTNQSHKKHAKFFSAHGFFLISCLFPYHF